MDIVITPEAERQYKRLPRVEQTKIKKKLLILINDAKAGKKLSATLFELRSLRAWPYRILYYIDEKSGKIYIVTIAHRQGVYK